MAANRATNLREALLMAGAGVPEHTTWAAVCAYLYDVPGDQPELLDMGGISRGIDPDRELAEAARATGNVTVGATVGACRHALPGRHAGPRSPATSSAWSS